MKPKIAIYGGSFNPPGRHSRHLVEQLVEHFDEVIVVPCGPRPDLLTTNEVASVHRAALADIGFRNLPKVKVDLFDLEQAVFSPTEDLEQRFASLGDLSHIVGAELAAGGSSGESIIQRKWSSGEEMWRKLRFVVVKRGACALDERDLPPQSRAIEMPASTSASGLIRETIFKREPYQHLVMPEVAEYIERYGLYRGRIPSRATRWTPAAARPLIVADQRNAKAQEWARHFAHLERSEMPNCVIAIGGDGTMLHAIRQHWRLRVPFFGVNAGHLGFLLNDAATVFADEFPPRDVIVRQLPLLYLSIQRLDGGEEQTLAFNDAWLERTSSQSAWIRLHVNDQVRIEKLVADGALVSTAAGSTAYARSMGVAPLLADSPGWLVVGSNVMEPAGWKSALLAEDSTVKFENVGGEKRPMEAFVDGESYGLASSMSARLSRIATAELAFCASHDMAEKIARIQFPPC